MEAIYNLKIDEFETAKKNKTDIGSITKSRFQFCNRRKYFLHIESW